MSDSDDDVDLSGAGAHASPDVILVSDPSVEGDAISSALRGRGFSVVDAPLAMLEARVVGESPRALVIDVDQAGAPEAIERLRELGAGAMLDVFCVGDPSRAAELGATRAAGRVFERPVDVDLLVAQIVAIAEPARAAHPSRGTTPPPSYAPRRETAPPLPRDSEAPLLSDFPRSGDPLEVAAILPGVEDPLAAAKHLPAALSPELEQLLAAAEMRIGTSLHPSSVPAPEDEVDLILSPELLASLDEPLEGDEEDSGTGSGIGALTPGPSMAGTRPQTAADVQSQPGPATGVSTSAGEPSLSGFSSSTSTEFVDTGAHSSPTHTVSQTSAGEAAPDRSDDAPATELFEASSLGRVRTPVPFVPPPSRVAPSAPSHANLRPSPPRPSAPHAPQPPDDLDPAHFFHPALAPGDAILAVARAIATRCSGSLAVTSLGALRRIVLHDGDVVTAGSGAPDETLVAFLAARGDLAADLAVMLMGKLPPSGRHAGAALIAYGHLGQDDLWPVLRAHAEWIIGRAISSESGSIELELEPPGRLRAEPGVFGGATGAEVLVETVRRVVPADLAIRRLGGPGARMGEGQRGSLLAECALKPGEDELVRMAAGRTLGDVLAAATPVFPGGRADPELASLLYALVALEVLAVDVPAARERPEVGSTADPLDEEAVRQRVRARLALVQEGDYFSLLGVPRTATSYEVRRAYLDLRRAFEPNRLLSASTADLADDLRLVVEVLEEAYEILREPHRRERYRRAIEAEPLA